MDPTQALTNIRETIAEMEELGQIEEDALASDVQTLDEWISKGGFLPEQWRRVRGRPRRTEDGVVVEGARHGTRAAYNKGCRCVPCTGANRDAATKQRQRARESK